MCHTARVTTRFADPALSNGHTSLLGKAAAGSRPARVRARGGLRRAVGRGWAAVRPYTLSLVSLGALDAALWSLPIGGWATVAGLAGIGVSGLLIDKQVDDQAARR